MSDRPLLVVDPTVIIKWYLPEVYSDEALKLLDSYEIATVDIAVSQVAGALGKRIRTGEVKAHEGKRIVENLTRLPIKFVPSATLASNAIELSAVSVRTFNESLYFVLALREKTRVITADFRWYNMLANGKLRNHIAFVNEVETPSLRSS